MTHTDAARASQHVQNQAEGVISKAEFEPRLAGLRQRVAALEAEAAARNNAAEQTRSLHLVIGKLETFASLVRERLDEADWITKRDLIRTLVRRIEVNDQHVRVRAIAYDTCVSTGA
jgi:site-specific DNA recombinase